MSARIGQRWEKSCARVGDDPTKPTNRSHEGFANSARHAYDADL